MATDTKPQSKLRIFLLWGALLACILIAPVFLLWRASNKPAMGEAPGAVYSIVMLVLAVLALAAGAAGYLAAIYTQCLTFNFSKPVWHEVKVKKYFANIIFPTLVMLGIGFTSSAIFTPMATQMGLPGQMGFMVPFFAAFALSQCVLIWVLVWAPLEKRVIEKRLAALGITPEQLSGGFYTGLSNPEVKGAGKRWYSIEEDMGMLWFTADQMIFWGDTEQFSLTRADIAQVEREWTPKAQRC